MSVPVHDSDSRKYNAGMFWLVLEGNANFRNEQSQVPLRCALAIWSEDS